MFYGTLKKKRQKNSTTLQNESPPPPVRCERDETPKKIPEIDGVIFGTLNAITCYYFCSSHIIDQMSDEEFDQSFKRTRSPNLSDTKYEKHFLISDC